jgi:hypothetical protein
VHKAQIIALEEKRECWVKGGERMNSLNDYFGKSPEQAKQDIKKNQELQKSEEINKLLENIKYEQCLWDMRAWKHYKETHEDRKWIREGCNPNNCGHVESV